MPGLTGFTTSNIEKGPALNTLKNMRGMITHKDFYIKDELFLDDNVCATRADLGFIQTNKQPFCDSGIYVWMHGEIYCREEMNLARGLNCKSEPELILRLYGKDNDFKFLKDLDGYYSAVIYDSNQKKVHIFSDRYGLKHIYYTVFEDKFIWGSEAKVVLGFPNYSPKVDEAALEDFLRYGQIIGDRTLLKDVELIPTGTRVVWDIKLRKLDKIRWWWWDHIKTVSGNLNVDELAHEMGRLFVESVEKRYGNGKRTGVMLSGGVDSRSIFAAIPDNGQSLDVITFGREGSDDVEIAKETVKLRKVRHHIIDINARNWLEPRIEGIWWSDGQFDLYHMHGIEAMPKLKELFDINLNGFGGGALLGDAFFGDPEWNNLKKIENRNRRMVILGPKTGGVFHDSRLPFTSYKLVDFSMSIPENLRYRYRAYRRMMLKYFHKYFNAIKWQHTGFPVSWPEWREDFYKRVKKLKWRFENKLIRLGVGKSRLSTYDFVDYGSWIREGKAKEFFITVLERHDALYPSFISRERVTDDLNKFMEGEHIPETICRYLTIEIWLNQVFNGKYLK